MEIYTTYWQSPALGLLEIDATETHICSIMFVEAKKRTAPLRTATDYQPEVTKQCIAELLEYFEGKRQDFTVPYQQKGTPFQLTVWDELTRIDYGKTISYLELARRLGNEKVIRAAASTNGNNQMTIIVPCHRVIGANGSLVGYGGDLWRKEWLLQHEAKTLGVAQQGSLF